MLKALNKAGIEWLRVNYSSMSQKACAEHLKVTTATIRKYASQIGLHKYDKAPKFVKPIFRPRPQPKPIEKPQPSGPYNPQFCQDCAKYIRGGYCGQNGRAIGALNEKECFTPKEE